MAHRVPLPLILLLLPSLFLANSVPAQDTHALLLRLKQGETYPLLIRIEQRITQKIQGMDQSIRQNLIMGFDFRIDEVDADGNMRGTMTYTRTGFDQGGPLGPIEYDSANPPASEDKIPVQARGFAALVGKSFRVGLTPGGRVFEISGLNTILTDVIEHFDLPPGTERESLARDLTSQFGDQAMRENLELFFGIYPDGPVQVGESWKRTLNLTQGIVMTLSSTWTLEEIRDETARISMESDISSPAESSKIRMSGLSLRYEIEGTQKGQIQVSLESGWPRQAELEQRFSGKLKATGIQGMPGESTWPIEVETRTTMTGYK